MVPGFIDAHAHVASSGFRHLKQVDCDLRSIAAIQAALRERAASQARRLGPRLQVRRHQDHRGPPAQPGRSRRRLPRSSGLRGASWRPHRLCQLPRARAGRRQRSHAGSARRPVRSRSRDRHAHGPARRDRPRAARPPHPREPHPRRTPRRRRIISKMLARAGVTSVHDACGTPDDLRAYQDAREAGDLGLRVYCSIGCQHVEQDDRRPACARAWATSGCASAA